MFCVVHISDLHFGAQELIYTHRELQYGLSQVFEELKNNKAFLLITGDITFRGQAQGYTEAESFVRGILTTNAIESKKLLLCPGNHDIVLSSDTPFKKFDAFSYALRHDGIFTYSSRNFVSYETDDALLVGLNTAFRLDHQYGSVDIESLRDFLSTIPKPSNKLRIAFLHHHLINQFERDSSALRNAYDLLMLLDEHKFDYIFHGHQHSNQFMPIGEAKMRIFGVRSFNFSTPGYPNGLNSYEISETSIKVTNYVFARDNVSHGRSGGLQKNIVNYSRRSGK
jgi:3',5'-cyclic AMP phosphodiesterase CpdA